MFNFDLWNHTMASSRIGRYFRLEASGHMKERKGSKFTTEISAGFATFFAMAYIISVNSQIVAQSGGTCVCTSTSDPTCTNDPEYLACVQEVTQDMVTATAAISALASVAMGVFANLPIAIGPGMGLNTWFTYSIVGFHGTGTLSYQSALTATFVQGLIMFLFTLLGLRSWISRILPASLKVAAGAGIGFYVALCGLTYSAGIGAVTGGTTDPLQLGGCTSDLLDPITGQCTSGIMRNPTMWLGIFCGGFATAILMLYRINGAIIFGILLVSIISWPRNTPFTVFPNTMLGDTSFDFFKQVVTFHPIKHVLNVLNWKIPAEEAGQFIFVLFTLLYVDILDLTGTLYSMASFAGILDPETQDFDGSTPAFLVDAAGISVGALLGLPPVTAFIESGAGIAEGGKTGITAVVTGLCFFVAIFFAPIFSSIPSWATGCTLILIGGMMAKGVVDINWRYGGDAIPAFLTLIVMPFTYSIAYGLIAGIISYAVLNGIPFILMKLSAGKLTPPDYDLAEQLPAREHHNRQALGKLKSTITNMFTGKTSDSCQNSFHSERGIVDGHRDGPGSSGASSVVESAIGRQLEESAVVVKDEKAFKDTTFAGIQGAEDKEMGLSGRGSHEAEKGGVAAWEDKEDKL